MAAWAETEIVLAADLGDGTGDPRATAPGLLRRALAALPTGRGLGPGGHVKIVYGPEVSSPRYSRNRV